MSEMTINGHVTCDIKIDITSSQLKVKGLAACYNTTLLCRGEGKDTVFYLINCLFTYNTSLFTDHSFVLHTIEQEEVSGERSSVADSDSHHTDHSLPLHLKLILAIGDPRPKESQ